MNRLGVATVLPIAAVVALLMSGCAADRGEPDRRETFRVTEGECTASWWLERLVEDVPAEAEAVARDALMNAVVTDEATAEWQVIIEDSDSSDAEIRQDRLEDQAHIEVVREQVRVALDAAGYPDAPTRVIEVYSALSCS
ncbi:hypothetical protein ACFFGH_10685 [Lysobacter korlensis]|uniref:Lipoprotein n=1 Tax=Lysobacter korlensis TaxID=553636 RepID=A0ABV6RMU8_9GAMM